MTNPASQHYYVYGYNNPVSFTDPSGETVPVAIFGGLMGAVVGAGAELVSCSAKGSCDTRKVLTSAGIGAAAGATAGLTLGLSTLAWVGVGVFSSGGANLANQMLVEERTWNRVDWGSVGLAGGSGALAGAVGFAVVGNPLSRSLYRAPGRVGPWMRNTIGDAAALEAVVIGSAIDVSLQRERGRNHPSFPEMASEPGC